MYTSSAEITSLIRLTTEELSGLCRAFEQVLAPFGDVHVLLFGSRVNLSQRGGDIDLLVICEQAPETPTTKLTRMLIMSIEDNIGEQKIDLVWDTPTVDSEFIRLAKKQGVLIWQSGINI